VLTQLAQNFAEWLMDKQRKMKMCCTCAAEAEQTNLAGVKSASNQRDLRKQF